MSLLLPLLALLSGLSLCLYLLRCRDRPSSYPPGPKPTWVIGNIHQIPKRLPWIGFARMAEQYGPVFMLKCFSRPLIVLNDANSIMEVLDRHSSTSNDRPTAYMVGELVGRKYTVFSTSSQDPRLRRYRKMLHSSLNPRKVKENEGMLKSEAKILAEALLESPDEAPAHLRRNAGANILKLAYGYTARPRDDEYVKIVEDGLGAVSAIPLGMQALLDGLPILRFLPEWMPFVNFKRIARQTKALSDRIQSVPFEWAKDQILSGSYQDSFVSQHWAPGPPFIPGVQKEEEDIVKWGAAALYSGGADTTVSTLTTLLHLLAHHPDVQRRAQEEVDSVVGPDRLPTLEDQASLPYCKAILKEVMRWMPAVPLGLRHRLTEDIVYNNMVLPAGSIIVPNVWAVMHDPKVYPDPSKFIPERHLGSTPQIDPSKFVWGFGRRLCAGIAFAEASMLLNMCTILSLFDVRPKKKEQPEELEWSGLLITHAINVNCTMIPRRSDVATLIANQSDT